MRAETKSAEALEQGPALQNRTSKMLNMSSVLEYEDEIQAIINGDTRSKLRRPAAGRPGHLAELRTHLAKWLSIPDADEDGIDVIMAVYKAHEIPGDPLWLLFIDAPGGGKTEILRAFGKRPEIYFLSSLTENTLVSGFRDPKQPNKDPSLLRELDEKVLIIKDLAPLVSMKRESRNVILSQLRDAYDGFSDQGRGNIGRVHYEARFSIIAAGTQAVDRHDAVDQELGERFIKFRARGKDTRSKVRKAIRNTGEDKPMRETIEQAIAGCLDCLPPASTMKIASALQDRLADLADFTARARSYVPRDRKGDLQYEPRPEVGTRLGKELGKLLMALAVVRGKAQPDDEDFATVCRVAEDCLPPNRLAAIDVLRSGGPVRTSDVMKGTGLPRTTAWRTLDDLRVLGLVSHTGSEDVEMSTWKMSNR